MKLARYLYSAIRPVSLAVVKRKGQAGRYSATIKIHEPFDMELVSLWRSEDVVHELLRLVFQNGSPVFLAFRVECCLHDGARLPLTLGVVHEGDVVMPAGESDHRPGRSPCVDSSAFVEQIFYRFSIIDDEDVPPVCIEVDQWT